MNKDQIKSKGNEMLNLFGAKTLRGLPDSVMEACVGGKHEVFDEYLRLYPDLSGDHLSEAFEALFADRAFMAQDFTPNSVGKLMVELALAAAETSPNEVLDECAGTGVLAINYWAANPDVVVYCREKSADTVPFLLFNLMVRNIRGFVVQGDTLTLETDKVFALSKGEKYSELTEATGLAECCNEMGVDPLRILRGVYREMNGLETGKTKGVERK